MEFRSAPWQNTMASMAGRPLARALSRKRRQERATGMTIATLPSSRRVASQRRRAPEIIEAAARVFAERGFHGATTQDIADVLGIRQASLYYYFSSKEAALELVCLKGVEGFFEAGKAIAARPKTARERLSLLINSHL